MSHAREIAGAVDVLLPELAALSDAIWAEPELRWEEHASLRRQAEVARRHGFEVAEGIAELPTAFVAERGTGGPVIAILGEYDALAGLDQQAGVAEPRPRGAEAGPGHGCGHNLLGSGSLLAAIVLADQLRERGLPGRVRYYGCPAEEAAAGKSFMVRAGVFDDVDVELSWHPHPVTMTRQILSLAYAQTRFRFVGVPAHAGVSPERGRSALDAVELMNVGVNFLREHMPSTARVHYAITDAGGESPNVVQARAEAYYLVRAETVELMAELLDRVVDIARGAALMTGTELVVDHEGASAELLPNDVLELALHGVAEELGGVVFDDADRAAAAPFAAVAEPRALRSDRVRAGLDGDGDAVLHDGLAPFRVDQPRTQTTGSTDVGDVSQVTPTVQIMVATSALGTPAHSWQHVAQGTLPAAHKGMGFAAAVLAGTGLRLATEPDLLAAARAEFTERTRTDPYRTPIPEGTVPPPQRIRDSR